MTEFICLPISPFSRRAKWALDCSGVPYKQTPWPMGPSAAGEAPLRRRLGRQQGRLTAPILIPEGAGPEGALLDSVDIAKWADANGSSPGSLFPPAEEAAIIKYVKDADRLGSYFRRQLALGALADPAVRRQMAPKLPWLVQLLMGWLVDRQVCGVMRRLVDKYPEDGEVTEEQVRALLQSMSEVVAASANGCLMPSGFSFADMAWATTLDAVAPGDPFAAAQAAAADSSKRTEPQFPGMSIPGLRALVEPYAALVSWKNEVLCKHKPASSSRR